MINSINQAMHATVAGWCFISVLIIRKAGSNVWHLILLLDLYHMYDDTGCICTSTLNDEMMSEA